MDVRVSTPAIASGSLAHIIGSVHAAFRCLSPPAAGIMAAMAPRPWGLLWEGGALLVPGVLRLRGEFCRSAGAGGRESRTWSNRAAAGLRGRKMRPRQAGVVGLGMNRLAFRCACAPKRGARHFARSRIAVCQDSVFVGSLRQRPPRQAFNGPSLMRLGGGVSAAFQGVSDGSGDALFEKAVHSFRVVALALRASAFS